MLSFTCFPNCSCAQRKEKARLKVGIKPFMQRLLDWFRTSCNTSTRWVQQQLLLLHNTAAVHTNSGLAGALACLHVVFECTPSLVMLL